MDRQAPRLGYQVIVTNAIDRFGELLSGQTPSGVMASHMRYMKGLARSLIKPGERDRFDSMFDQITGDVVREVLWMQFELCMTVFSDSGVLTQQPFPIEHIATL